MTPRGERRLPASVVELLERFGSEMRCGAADRLFFDKAAIQRLEKHFCDRRSSVTSRVAIVEAANVRRCTTI
jgi:hypothetical protein